MCVNGGNRMRDTQWQLKYSDPPDPEEKQLIPTTAE
jgi:hypothetical protein